jgi:hypothetical protein
MSTTLTAASRGRGVLIRGLAALHATPKLLLGGVQEVLVERVGMHRDLDPFAAAGDHREHRRTRRDHPHVVLQLRHVLLGVGLPLSSTGCITAWNKGLLPQLSIRLS